MYTDEYVNRMQMMLIENGDCFVPRNDRCVVFIYVCKNKVSLFVRG